jgi:hypothetical protein
VSRVAQVTRGNDDREDLGDPDREMKAAGLKQPTCVAWANAHPAFAANADAARFYFFHLQSLFLNASITSIHVKTSMYHWRLRVSSGVTFLMQTILAIDVRLRVRAQLDGTNPVAEDHYDFL